MDENYKHSLYARRSSLAMVGNHVDAQSGKGTAVYSGFGAGVDSCRVTCIRSNSLSKAEVDANSVMPLLKNAFERQDCREVGSDDGRYAT